ncbi:hypothetical protein NBH00_14185 [Paraconexibacter antarcticus]|uniref:Uncharacterized protein n=1 Tax=Paraconexibacter antarcticus TaxID=2949664 RepID=A0ABY5DL43_9ACTN|nr:hypothetical protein [Paraconexibacter antarcticus]UTI62511.1 hypothetical protein NBH00_14185 [Paraconexibacter antarcticus]
MRSIVDFYRRNPVVLGVALVVGLGLSVLTAAAGSGGIIGPIVLALAVGVLVGLGVAFTRAGDRDGDGDADEPDVRD